MNTLETLYRGLNDLVTVADSELEARLERLSHPDAEWHLSDPIGLCAGNDAVAGQLLTPLRQALGHLHRRPELFISGESRVNDGDSWIAGFGHWVGNLTGPLLGLQPHDHLVFLRYGEFYRVREGHRIPFLTAFPDRVGGNHYARFGDGPYACSSGWPSIHATHKGDYLGVKATGNLITMRVMDWWRAEDGQLIENWVLIDFVDLFSRMGVGLFARARQQQAG